jgi:NitT/TauT family transport system substrate-binding protein
MNQEKMGTCVLTGSLKLLFAWFVIFMLYSSTYAVEKSKQADVLSKYPLKLTLQWFPQAQFAGYYVAKEKGYFKAAGLEVDLQHKQPQDSMLDLLENGQTDFITNFLAAGIKARSNGSRIVNIAQISQKSSLVFVSRKKSGISKLTDITGKTTGLWSVDFKVIPEIMLRKNRIKTKVIPVVSGVGLFLWGVVDVITVTWYNEYHELLSAGINEDELTTFFFSKYNLDIPEDGIYCHQSTWKRRPETCRRLAQAVLKGWRTAFADKNATLKIVKEYCQKAHIPFNMSHQRWMLDTMEKLIFPENSHAGMLTPATYRKTAKLLQTMQEIKTIPAYSDFYKDISTSQKANK